jgi:hypothetical protein
MFILVTGRLAAFHGCDAAVLFSPPYATDDALAVLGRV